ncbi:MAG TPA: DUF47 family protein [Kofleriaceae bacterium]|nr:DUF47 family protein [Kofleriaceae bacterium]
MVLTRLLPRSGKFYDFFERHAKLIVSGAVELAELVANPVNLEARAKRIKEIEHESDVITHQCVEALHKTTLVPFRREDIHRLIGRMDDIMDYIEAVAERISLYDLREMTTEVTAFTETLTAATRKVEEAVRGLRDLKHPSGILENCIEINRLENQGDAILRSAVARLFKEEKDAVLVIKWKEIYEHLEEATDRCEDVANIIEGVVLENT